MSFLLLKFFNNKFITTNDKVAENLYQQQLQCSRILLKVYPTSQNFNISLGFIKSYLSILSKH